MKKAKIKKWIQLQNGYWLKILVFKANKRMQVHPNTYFLDIVVGKTKRIVNDHYNSTRKSPKSLYCKSSNNRGGIESFMKTLEFIKELIPKMPKGSTLRVEGADERRIKVYSRLTRYGFLTASWYSPGCSWHKKQFYFMDLL